MGWSVCIRRRGAPPATLPAVLSRRPAMRPFVLLLSLTLAGCAGTRVFRPDAARFTRRYLDGRVATVVLRDGRSVRAATLRVSADSVVWADPASREVDGAPIHEVARIEARSSSLTVGRSALTGIAVAGVAGTLGGYALLLQLGGSPAESLRPATLFGVMSMPLGALYGTVGGAVAPATWMFVPDLPPRATSDTSRTARSFAAPRLAP